MNLFYEKAAEAFADESIVANVWTKSPLELVGDKFTRAEFYEAVQKCGKKSPGHCLLAHFIKRGKIARIGKDDFAKVSK